MAKVLREDDLLGIFPEGAITRDGQLQLREPGPDANAARLNRK